MRLCGSLCAFASGYREKFLWLVLAVAAAVILRANLCVFRLRVRRHGLKDVNSRAPIGGYLHINVTPGASVWSR